MSKYLAEAIQLLHSHRFLEAAEQCQKALSKKQNVLKARLLLATCYYSQGVVHLFESKLIQDAADYFQLAIEENPRHTDAIQNLAGCLVELGRQEEAIPLYRRAIDLEPKRISILRDLAICYQRLDRLDEASATLQALIQADPENGGAVLFDALLLKSIIPHPEYPEQIRQRIQEKLQAFDASGLSITDPMSLPANYFFLSYHGLCNKQIHEKIAESYLRATPSLSWRAPHLDAPRNAGRIRIGIASSFLYNHSIGHTTRGLVEMLDRSRFEVIVIHLGNPPSDEIAKAINAAADRVVHVPYGDLQNARECIAALSLDILFWQDIGMEPFSYFLAFARLSPVQLTSFGHPDTTGIPNVDYFLSSSLYETAAEQHDYAEKLILVPNAGTLSYYHRPVTPPAASRQDLGLPDEAHVYLCPQTLFKLHPDMDELFLEIVRLDAKAIIVLIAPSQTHMASQIEQRLQKHAADLAGRVRFIKRLSYKKYLQLLQSADVILDTLHFNGQNTSLEGLAVGTPVVTMPGRLQRARHTYGMYRAMNFMELIAKDKTDFAAKAVAVVCDADFRTHCRASIAQLSGQLYQNQAFVSACEDAFTDMFNRI